jgi:hypothetical protein
MAHAKVLDNIAIEQVRADVGAFLNTHPNPAIAKGPTFIKESFEIFEFKASAISAAAMNPRGMAEFLHRTGRWHHQVVQRGVAVGIAQSGAARTFHEGWTIYSLAASPLAGKVARAIEKLDRDRPSDDLEAIYVTVPSFKIMCFLLRGYSSEEIFVISSAITSIEEGRFYSVTEFLESLARCKRIRGLRIE